MKKTGKCFIVAEAGVNHNGKLSLAKKLIDAARMSGADAVKFQMFKTDELVTRSVPKAAYQRKRSSGLSQYEMLQKLELSAQQFKTLAAYAKKKKILFLATPHDSSSATFLRTLKMPMCKIGSGDLTNTPFLKEVARFGVPLILSTGMATIAEVRRAVKAIRSARRVPLTLLHCTTAYPTEIADVNLNAMVTLQKTFRVPVGYSDHTQGIAISAAAVALGATVIEKHFTLDKSMVGPDHRASLNPKELAQLCKTIRDVEVALGSFVKKPTKEEKAIMKIARKSLVARVAIPAGRVITQEMVATKRPGTGIPPYKLASVVGKRPKKNIAKGSLIQL